MRVERVAAVGFWIVVASTAAMGQQQDDRAGLAPNVPVERVVVRTYPLGGVLPSRSVETRSDSGNREVVTETIEMPDLDGRPRPTEETVTETTRTGPDTVRTKRDVFGFGAPGRRMLLETTLSERETLPDGTIRTVRDTLAPDVNGRLGLRSRQVQRTESMASGMRRTDTAVFEPGINEGLRESARIQETERQVTPDVLRYDSTRFVRDANGRFQPTETLSREVRTSGTSESVEDETLRRLDVDGKLTSSERHVTRRFEANGRAHVIEETFSRDVAGLVLSGNRLELTRRVRRTTTPAADEGGRTIEEVEARVPGSPNEPIRMVQRTAGTISKVGTQRWDTRRRVYIVDVNGRLVLDFDEAEESTVR